MNMNEKSKSIIHPIFRTPGKAQEYLRGAIFIIILKEMPLKPESPDAARKATTNIMNLLINGA